MFASILFKNYNESSNQLSNDTSEFITDLNLDQIISSITTGKEEYKLTPFFFRQLHDEKEVKFRHEIMRDMENVQIGDIIKSFAKRIRAMRRYLAKIEKRSYQQQKERWFLDAVNSYIDAVSDLNHDLPAASVASSGLKSFLSYVKEYASSQTFTSLVSRTKTLKTALSNIRYSILIKGTRVEIHPYHNESDYRIELKETFNRFYQATENTYSSDFRETDSMDEVEGQIVEQVAQLFHDTFAQLTAFCKENENFLDSGIVLFDREIQFYLSYLELMEKLRTAGLQFCYPQVSKTNKEIYARDTYDLALADRLNTYERKTPVVNDFYLKGSERIIVVTGPNQGGKTTFARMLGQLHYYASLGLPVPGSNARLFLPDKIYSHFEKEEKITNLKGKLQDDLIRIHRILQSASPKSLIIINEIFNSTTLEDTTDLSKKIIKAIVSLDSLCVWVTFIDELTTYNEKIVSMVSTVEPDDPDIRTFKIIRQPANGLAYADAIARKYHITYSEIKKRIKI